MGESPNLLKRNKESFEKKQGMAINGLEYDYVNGLINDLG